MHFMAILALIWFGCWVRCRNRVGRAGGLEAQPDWVKDALLEQQASRVNSEGELVVTSQLTRSQANNRADALRKLRQFVAAASHLPPVGSVHSSQQLTVLLHSFQALALA